MKWLMALSFLLAQSAFADQCAWNSRTDANSAIKLIKNNEIIFWCQNCGESKPSKIFKVTDIKVKKENIKGLPPGRIINVKTSTANPNGSELDLAYTYVRTGTDIFTNIAHLVGCPSDGATSFIQTGPGVKKVAHYYDEQGRRVDWRKSNTDLSDAEFSAMDKSRVPASAK